MPQILVPMLPATRAWIQQVIWPPEAPLDMHKKYSLCAYGFKRALITDDGVMLVN